MRHYFAYTGNQLLVGEGRSIRHVAADSHEWQNILEHAREQKVPRNVDSETFIAALAAMLAAQELDELSKQTTTFSSIQQVFRLFDDVDIEQAALNIINGRVASGYIDADAITQGFSNGALWTLAHDGARLHTKETLANLPGAVATLLAHGQAQRKSFAGYLRRGTPPVVTAEALKTIATARPVLRSFAREARLIAERRKP